MNASKTLMTDQKVPLYFAEGHCSRFMDTGVTCLGWFGTQPASVFTELRVISETIKHQLYFPQSS